MHVQRVCETLPFSWSQRRTGKQKILNFKMLKTRGGGGRKKTSASFIGFKELHNALITVKTNRLSPHVIIVQAYNKI